MVDVLFFPVVIVAEEIAAADYKNEVFLHKQFEGVLELKAEELVIVEEVEAAELVPGEEEDLGVVEGVEGEDVFADGEGGGFGLGVGHQLVGVGLVDEGGAGQVGNGDHFGLLGQFVRPAVLEHEINIIKSK